MNFVSLYINSLRRRIRIIFQNRWSASWGCGKTCLLYTPPLEVWAWLLVGFETEIFQGPSRSAQLKTFTLTLPHPGVETRSPIWKPQLEHTADRAVVSFLLFHNPDSYVSGDFIIKIPCVKVLDGSFQDPQSSDSHSRKFIDLYKVLECVYKTRLNKLES